MTLPTGYRQNECQPSCPDQIPDANFTFTYDQVPANCPIRFVAGDDVKVPFQLLSQTTANNITTNIPVNITGYAFETGITINNVTFTGNVDVISNANGTVAANFTDSQTTNMTCGFWSWYLRMTDNSNYTRTIVLDLAEIVARG